MYMNSLLGGVYVYIWCKEGIGGDLLTYHFIT
jgi:hypothetical protein